MVSDFTEVVLPAPPTLPGMTSAAEGRYLYWLAARQWTGRGALVEVGTWLGRSTLHLAAGLRASALPGKLHAFDDFLWRRGDGTKLDIGLRAGESFQACFEANLADDRDLLAIERCGIADLRWSGGPIEILPMTPGQSHKIAQLARTHHFLNYPELFAAAGHGGSPKQRALVPLKRLRNAVRRWSGGG